MFIVIFDLIFYLCNYLKNDEYLLEIKENLSELKDRGYCDKSQDCVRQRKSVKDDRTLKIVQIQVSL